MNGLSEGNNLNYILIVLGFLAGFIVEFFFGILSRHYEEYRERVSQKRLLRGDLRARLRNFCDQWEDRDCMIPAISFRKDLVEIMIDIRESLNDEFAQLKEEEKVRIRNITKDFLKVANEFQNDDDSAWSKKIENKMEDIIRSLRDIAEKLG